MQRTAMITALKQALRRAGVTYAEVARRLGLSEASIKRVFHKGDMPLSRVEAIAAIAGVSLAELVDAMGEDAPLLSELTGEQEEELLADARLLLMAYMLVNGWSPDEVIRRYRIEPSEKAHLLARLRELGFIEMLPFDRIRVLTARNFRWRPDGPVQRLFLEYVQRDFLSARFDRPDEALYLLGGVLSPASRHQLARSIRRLAVEIDELSRQDARLPQTERQASGAVLALRAWEFETFARLRRDESDVATSRSS